MESLGARGDCAAAEDRFGVTTQDAIRRRIRVPLTPSEVAALFGLSVKLARGYLYQLRKQGKAKRLDRRIPKQAPRGRQWEYLWSAK